MHYFLGFPPYRTGGLTKYAFDLAKGQATDGHEVFALWPGEIRNYLAEPRIKQRKSIEGIRNYELINPLPIPLDEGINEFEAYTKPCNIDIYKSFLKSIDPDVIHIHTLMGMHKEFVQAANQLKIRTVFTSHDYFGLCPKVTLYRYGECCDDDNECRKCIQCNAGSLSLKIIKLMQSPLYRWAKDTPVVKKIRKRHRGQFFGEETVPEMPDVDVEKMAEKYRKLRDYYVSIYETVDFIHFNSTLAESVYKRYLTPSDNKVMPITHLGIQQHTRHKVDTGKKVILCLAHAKPFKGWNVLKTACDELYSEGVKFELRVYSPVSNPEPYMIVKENGFVHSELEQMMSEADVVVVPSICYETFGFVVLESLCYCVPVIVSDHVGAKDIVGGNGMVVEAGNVNQLKKAIISIDMHVEMEIVSWRQFLEENYIIYKSSNI